MSRIPIALLICIILVAWATPIYADGALPVLNSDLETYSGGTANNWSQFWIPNGVSGSVGFFSSTSVKHRGYYAQGINLASVGTTSNFMIKSYCGIYQRISATAGKVYTASAHHYIDMPYNSTNVVALSIGIDPTGGINPTSSSVVWSNEAWNGLATSSVYNWKQALVAAKATSSYVTVFLRCTIIPSRISMAPINKVYFDQVYLMESTPYVSPVHLSNGGFDGSWIKPDTQMIDAYPESWLPFGSTFGNNNAVTSSTSSFDGSHCISIVFYDGRTADTGWGVCQQVQAIAGEQYEIFGMTKGSVGDWLPRRIGIDPSGSLTPTANTIWAEDRSWDNAWHRLHVGPVTATSSAVTVFASVENYYTGNGIAWLDEIELLQVGNETIAPAAVTNLYAFGATPTTVNLTWTTTGDDGNLGQATSFDIRYSTSPISESNWNSATAVADLPVPPFHGETASKVVEGLAPSTSYYFAVKVIDECENASPVSNLATATTQADNTPPDAITNLTPTNPLYDSVKLTWTAPVSVAWNGVNESAVEYEIRYSTSSINSTNWSSATPVTAQVPPLPASPGQIQSTWVRGLQPSTTYYFAIRSRDIAGNWSNVSNIPSISTTGPGSAPYWANALRDRLQDWYNHNLEEATKAAADVTASNPYDWYFDSIDKDCEAQPSLNALLQVVRDEEILQITRDVSDHVWWLTLINTNIDKNHFLSTGEKIPTWNESHHLGEVAWNGVGLAVTDYDNPKWLDRLHQYCGHYDYWCGYTGDESNGGPHLHFKSMWFKAYDWDRSDERGEHTLVDVPEDRRLTRPAWYASWRDPSVQMTSGQTVKDWLYELCSALAEDAMRTDLGKPIGVLPGEIRFDTHQIGGYSGEWWRASAPLGGELYSDDQWWWDWRVGWTPMRDAYYGFVDQYLLTGEEKFIIPVRESIRYFNIDQAINNIPPAEMYSDLFPWPDKNNPYGHFQYLVNYIYRQATGDTQFDDAWIAHAQQLWEVLPPPGAPRYGRLDRRTLEWVTNEGTYPFRAPNSFMLAWKATGDKEWLAKAIDELICGDVWFGHWMEVLFTGTLGVSANRLPDYPITWNNTNKYTNWAGLVMDWDYTHIRWQTYNFDSVNRVIPVWLWSLKPGNYVLRYGPDMNLDDKMDYVEGELLFTYSQRRTEISTTLPANRMQIFEIVPVEQTIDEAKNLADGSLANIGNLTVTAAFDGFFYVENSDRTMGIRVESLADVQPGDVVSVSGTMETLDGERRIKCVNPTITPQAGSVPKPIGMPLKLLGGGADGLQEAVMNDDGPSVGVNNVGLLVRVCGRVVDSGNGYIIIDDGSSCYTGDSVRGVKVMTSQVFEIDDYVSVTGISSCEKNSQEEVVRLIRAKDNSIEKITLQ